MWTNALNSKRGVPFSQRGVGGLPAAALASAAGGAGLGVAGRRQRLRLRHLDEALLAGLGAAGETGVEAARVQLGGHL